MQALSAVVLAAGEGTRLRPLTRHRPKPMLPGATRPILEHVLDQLVEAGITDITLVVGHGRTRVQSHFGPTYRNVPLTYTTQETQLGTGHALLTAEQAVDGPCLVVYGDQLVDTAIIRDVVAAHRAAADEADAPAATLGLLESPAAADYGGVILEEDQVVEIVERPQDDRHYLLNAGVYVLEPQAFAAVRAAKSRRGEQSLVDGLAHLLKEGDPVYGTVSEGLWVDATYPWDLLEVAVELFDADVVDGSGANSTGDSSATVHESAVIREPVAVAPDCEIGPGAVVGPYAALGANVTIGSNAVVERSVLDRDTRVGANATVIDCVTGVGVTIGAGSIIPGGPGDVRVGDRVFEGERLGALLADHVTDRGGVTYCPGTIVGADSTIAAGAKVAGTLAEKTEVRS